MMLKLWIDDVRPAPNGYIWVKSVNDAKTTIQMYRKSQSVGTIFIDMDHDAGDYAYDGGDYIKLLDWLEEKNIPDANYTFHLHSMNPVGRMQMRQIILYNNWRLA